MSALKSLKEEALVRKNEIRDIEDVLPKVQLRFKTVCVSVCHMLFVCVSMCVSVRLSVC